MQDAFHTDSGTEIVIDKLSVDNRGRIFVSKKAGRFLKVLPGDEVILSSHEGSNSLLLKIQRMGHVAESFLLVPLENR